MDRFTVQLTRDQLQTLIGLSQTTLHSLHPTKDRDREHTRRMHDVGPKTVALLQEYLLLGPDPVPPKE